MAKISIDEKGQARITIPSEIIQMKGWNKSTEILVSPLLLQPIDKLGSDTPIVIKEIKQGDKK
ncbi:MAG: hypothetical protein ACREBJ_07200 [Nitrosotalea sp.]